jgi:hypothetical protein
VCYRVLNTKEGDAKAHMLDDKMVSIIGGGWTD